MAAVALNPKHIVAIETRGKDPCSKFMIYTVRMLSGDVYKISSEPEYMSGAFNVEKSF
ncbi:MAG: hypothetical protein KF822_12440 [Steroidobacteraceae bacterium]|nr:hypothetical protein [Steroidobacteraceae bacterium]